MLKTYRPKKFCREFVAAKGDSLQLPMIMACVLGLKPAMDDWVPVERLPAYTRACKKYGLHMRPDAVFHNVLKKDIPPSSRGRERLTTTKAFGARYTRHTKTGSVHVFLSRSKSHLQNAFASGWYPLIIKNRVVDRPLADAFKYGVALGYPDCCVQFFRGHNNWFRTSYLYEALLNSAGQKPVYLCNPFNKDATYSYIYHMPCSYHCLKTIDWAGRIRSAIRSEDPAFTRAIDRHLKRPYLVFYEQKQYAFDGRIRGGCLHYTRAVFTGVLENDLYGPALDRGNNLCIDRNAVVVRNQNRLVCRIEIPPMDFAPETPFLIDFS